MNDTQKALIEKLRRDGLGYMRIAKETGLSANTIKSYLRRHPLGEKHTCLNCGRPVVQNKGRKEKKFCSDECRMAWCDSHRELVKRKNGHEMECGHCHKKFTVYGNSRRKYCSFECYLAERFGSHEEG